MIIKEIYYILLTSKSDYILKNINTNGTPSNKIANAINWLKNNCQQSFKIEELLEQFGMTKSSFYRHFNRITTMSPLQYQKQLRLYETRRLMLTDGITASNAAYKVGYESVSQLNREYKRMFGVTLKIDIKNLKLV